MASVGVCVGCRGGVWGVLSATQIAFDHKAFQDPSNIDHKISKIVAISFVCLI